MDMEEVAKLENDPSYRQFRSEKSRMKFRNFVKITKIRSQIMTQSRKPKNNNSDHKEMAEVAIYECLTCGKEFKTPLTKTSNILRHLKTHGIEKTDVDNQYNETEEEPIPQERSNRPNTLFVVSNITSKPTMKKLCRLCARRSTSLQPIFRMYSGRLLNDLISNLCPIQIEPGDSLPKQICDECLEIVVSANALRETSLQSDINFRSGNSPEEAIQVKEEQVEDASQFEDDQMIEYAMPSSSQKETKQDDFNSKTTKKCTDKSKPIERQARRFDYASDEATSTSGKAFGCDFCKETFAQKASIEQHMKAVHFKNLNIKQPHRISCPLNCGVTFTSTQSVKYHIKHLHKAEVVKFRCNFGCDKIFLSENKRLNHERMETCTPAPSIQDMIFCHICGKNMQSASMRRHILSHKNIKPYQCTQCPAKFFTKGHLERHRSVHTKDRPFSCDKCGNTFKDERSLRKHGLSIHDKIRPEKNTCEFCGKKFFTSFAHRQHVRTHTGEKPFKCKFCEMSYAQSADLLRHLGRAHELGDSIYGCTIESCTESFRLKSELVDHFKVHYQSKATS